MSLVLYKISVIFIFVGDLYSPTDPIYILSICNNKKLGIMVLETAHISGRGHFVA
jgi:hypothetical protein